jgi:hypothetical protein
MEELQEIQADLVNHYNGLRKRIEECNDIRTMHELSGELSGINFARMAVIKKIGELQIKQITNGKA